MTGRRDTSADAAARQLLRRVYEASYCPPKGFGGFRAALYYPRDSECRSETVEVRYPKGP